MVNQILEKKYSVMKKLMFLLVTAGFVFACGPADREESTTTVEEVVDHLEDRLTSDWIIYKGEVPCVDCDAIEMELWLEVDRTLTTPDYRLNLNYKNTPVGDTKEEVEGIYTIISGYGQDREAVVYQLNPGSNEPRYFLLNEEDKSLTMLGDDMQLLDEEDEKGLNYTLELKEERQRERE